MAAMIILSLCAVIIAVIGAWYFIAQDNFWMFIICIVLAFAGIVASNKYLSNETERDIKNQCNEIIAEKNAEIESLKAIIEENKSDTYYLNAEILNQIDLNNGNYAVNFINTESGNIYTWIGEYEYPDDVPYLLTMDSKETDNVKDDEIIVVWMDMD